MSNRFLSRGVSKNNDDDDLVRRQLSALGDVTEKTDFGDIDNSKTGSVGENCDNVEKQHYENAQPAPEAEKKSVLQQGVVITGSITSSTALFIYGTVKGNVTCESDVTIDGNIEGNVKAGNIQMLNGHIKGDIESKCVVNVLKGAVIDGNIAGETLCCDGRIEGNTNVNGKVAINENAIVIGDIVCEKISIREGAVCNGKMQTDATKTRSAVGLDASAGGTEKSKKKENVQMGNVTDLKKYV